MSRALRIALVLAVLCIGRTPRALAQEQGPTYVVQPGDTLSAIAQKFGTSVEALVQANAIANPSSLSEGQRLVIPGFEGISGDLTTREVAFGEDVASLGLRYGVPAQTLARLNRIVNPGRIYVGQELILPEEAEAANPAARARIVLPGAGEGLLELSARLGVSPSVVAALNTGAARAWIAPGAPLAVPGGESAPTGLPEPIVRVDVEPAFATQGRTTEVRIGLSSPALAEGALGDRQLHFNQLDSLDLVALQGVDALTEPGLYDLRIDLYASEGGALTYSMSQPIRLRSGGYGFDPVLSVPPETLDPANVEPEEALFSSVVDVVTPDKLWEGSFEFPSSYYTESFPSVFGTRRNYNNLGYNYYHTGLDFYGGTGVPILAPARGRVAFAGPLTVRGNTTIIDHGWGVFTVYMHQSEILVGVGDLVETGDTIGLVGATGRVTGPHLHWEVRVGGVPVNPLEWVQQTFP